MTVIAPDTVDALYTAANFPSTHRNGKLELVLPDGTSALVYVGPLMDGHQKVLVLQVVEEMNIHFYFAKPPKKGKKWYFDNWQPTPLEPPVTYQTIPEAAKLRPLLVRILAAVESNNPPQLPPGFKARPKRPEPLVRKLAGYKYQPAMIGRAEHKRLPFNEAPEVHEALDAIADACERGVLQSATWVLRAFATVEVFDNFMEMLAEYDECYRIHDRWYQALMRLGDTVNEEGFVTSSEIAERLIDRAVETGQIESA